MQKTYLSFAVLIVFILGVSSMMRQRKDGGAAVSKTTGAPAISAEMKPAPFFAGSIDAASSQEKKLKALGVPTAAPAGDLILAGTSNSPELRKAYVEFKTVRMRLNKDVHQLNKLNEALTRLGEWSPEVNLKYHRYQQEVLKNYKSYVQAGAVLRQRIVADMNKN